MTKRAKTFRTSASIVHLLDEDRANDDQFPQDVELKRYKSGGGVRVSEGSARDLLAILDCYFEVYGYDEDDEDVFSSLESLYDRIENHF